MLLFGSGTRGDLAVDVAVEPGAAFLEKLGETAAHGLVVTVAEMELAGELFERKALPPRAMQRGEDLLGIHVHMFYLDFLGRRVGSRRD